MARTKRLFYTTSHHCWGGGRESLPRRRALFWISTVAEGASGMSWVSVRIVCLFLVPSVTSIVAVTVFYLIAVSIKLFLSQPMIFTFCASNSPLQHSTGKDGGGLESLTGSTRLGSTIPKQLGVSRKKTKVKLINFLIFQVLRN